jgi:hypothetical protein
MASANEVRLHLDMRTVDAQELVESKGYTVALSETGCHVVGDRSLSEGQLLELRVYVPDLEWPIRIDQARVTWTEGLMFGLAFVRLPASDLRHLREIISHLGNEHTA